MNEELKEWLGIKPADFIVYLTGVAIVGIYFSKNITVDIILSIASVILCVISCFMGMKSDSRLSSFSNCVKRIAYPLCLIVVIICIYLNFSKWNIAEPLVMKPDNPSDKMVAESGPPEGRGEAPRP